MILEDTKHKSARRPRIASPLPEWGDVRTVERLFSIKETALYGLLRAGKIKSVLIRKPGRARGKRLISLYSLRQYLSKLEEVSTQQ